MLFIDYFCVHRSVRAIDALKACIIHIRWSKLDFIPCLSVLMKSASKNLNLKKTTSTKILDNTKGSPV